MFIYAYSLNVSLKDILSTGGVKERALILLSATSGIKIGEALKLRINEHLELNNDPPIIRITADIAEKGDKRITFCTYEAKEYLIKWLNQRDRYIKNKDQKCNFKIEMDLKQYENRVFPFSKSVAEQLWYKLSEKAGYTEKDERTGRRKLTIHQLRKYFRTTLGTKIQEDVIEALMGHENQLKRAYRKYTETTLATEYKKGMRALNVFKTDTVTRKEFDDQAAEIELYKINIRGATDQIKSLELQIDEIEEKIDIFTNRGIPLVDEVMSDMEPAISKTYKYVYGVYPTKEQLEEIKKEYRQIDGKKAFNNFQKIPKEKLFDLLLGIVE